MLAKGFLRHSHLPTHPPIHPPIHPSIHPMKVCLLKCLCLEEALRRVNHEADTRYRDPESELLTAFSVFNDSSYPITKDGVPKRLLTESGWGTMSLTPPSEVRPWVMLNLSCHLACIYSPLGALSLGVSEGISREIN